MPKLVGTATEFAIETLRKYPDNEVTIADLHALCDGRFRKENLHNALTRLLARGLIVRTVEPNRNAYWAISAQGMVHVR